MPRTDPFDKYWRRIEWDDSFQHLIETNDDVELCDRLFLLVHQERSDEKFNENEPDLCVFLVWGALGVLDNGGFQYLFEGDYKPTDPNLCNTRRAFEIVGLRKVVKAFDVAFSAFDRSTPPKNAKQRLKIWGAADKALRDRADKAWFSNNRISHEVAAFIRRRKDELLPRYGFVRKWPENPNNYVLISAEAAAALNLELAPATLALDGFGFNFRKSFEKTAWFKALKAARKKFGAAFGPRHVEYPNWEKWYLKNRKRLLNEVLDGIF